jgi:uncharacterized membrane protein
MIAGGWNRAVRPYNSPMRIAKPLLLITTPIGLAIGLYEGWRLAGGLVFIMAALILVIGAAFGTVVWTIRRERAEEEKKKLASEEMGTFPISSQRNSPRDDGGTK